MKLSSRRQLEHGWKEASVVAVAIGEDHRSASVGSGKSGVSARIKCARGGEERKFPQASLSLLSAVTLHRDVVSGCRESGRERVRESETARRPAVSTRQTDREDSIPAAPGRRDASAQARFFLLFSGVVSGPGQGWAGLPRPRNHLFVDGGQCDNSPHGSPGRESRYLHGKPQREKRERDGTVVCCDKARFYPC